MGEAVTLLRKALVLAAAFLVVMLGLNTSVLAAQKVSSTRVSKAPSWTIQKTVQDIEESSVLNGVACTSSTDCTALGTMVNPAGLDLPLLAQWSGGSWTYTPLAAPGFDETLADGGGFNGVSCTSTTSCLAVGWMGSAGNTPAESFAAEVNGSDVTYLTAAEQGA